MTQKENGLLLHLLEKAKEEGALQIYQTELTYDVVCCFEENGKVYIRIEEE